MNNNNSDERCTNNWLLIYYKYIYVSNSFYTIGTFQVRGT